MIRATTLLLLTSLLSSTTVIAEQAISDQQKFVSYPYLEKAYRYQAANDYANAIVEIKKAIAIAPQHSPYQILLFEYLVANKQHQQALSVYESLPDAARGNLLARLIESQIKHDELGFSAKLKSILQQAPEAQREQWFSTVAGHLIGTGQEAKLYHWLQSIEVKSTELLTTKIILADKLGNNAAVQQTYQSLDTQQITPQLTRIYVLSLLKNNNVNKALDYANQRPDDPLSVDVYNQYLQTSIANKDQQATEKAFAWLAAHRQLSPQILQQQLEFAIQNKDRESAFSVLAQLNAGCQQRIDLALSFDWRAKASEQLINCRETMQTSTWISYASSILSTAELQELVLANTSHTAELSELLIDRHIGNKDYPMAITEILRSNKQHKYLEQLAISYEKIGNTEQAIKYWEKLYLRSATDTTLDKVTFLQSQHSQAGAALALLEKRLLTSPTDMPALLVARLLSLYPTNSPGINERVISSLGKLTNNFDAVAELLRVYGHCQLAQQVLARATVASAQSFQTRALCTAASDQALALTYWQQAQKLAPNDNNLRSMALAQAEIGELDHAIANLEQIAKSAWSQQDYLFAAQLTYQQSNYQQSQAYWQLAKADNEAWLDFGIELAIQQQQYSTAQTLSQQLLVLKGDLSALQWARQATIYQRTEQGAKAARAWQIASEKAPDNNSFKLAYAYSLVDIQKQQALQIMKQVIASSDHVDTRMWEQLGYLAAANQDHPAALAYITKSIATESTDPSPRGAAMSYLLYEYYRDLSQHWRFNMTASQGTGGILGEVFLIGNNGEQLTEPPTNNITARAEYYPNPLTKRWSVYGQLSGNGDDHSPLNDWSKEFGVTYKPFDQYNVKGSLGGQRFFSGDWEGLVRINGDMLNQGKWRQDWRFEEEWWEREVYFEMLWLPESDQFLGSARADLGRAYPLETESRQTLKFYGVAQYDIRKSQTSVNGKSSLDQTSVGLGVQWQLYTNPDSPFDPVHRYGLALEWRYKVAGDLTKDNSSLFLIASYQY